MALAAERFPKAQNGVPAVTRGAAMAHPHPVLKGSVGQTSGQHNPNHKITKVRKDH